jgi:dihydropteroate synthase
MSISDSNQAMTNEIEPAFKLQFDKRPLVMGVLNVTPDSFSDGGKFLNPEKAAAHAILMAEQRADIIDIGGESSRPGAAEIGANEEIDRVLPVLEMLKGKLNIPISIDTRRSEVARKACQAGASIINDISGLVNDEAIADVASEMNSYLILMHMRGTSATMQLNIHYDNLIKDISDFLARAASRAIARGVSRDRIIIDPGIGFGKTVEHNFSLIKHIPEFAGLGYPVLIGASRKSFIGKTLGVDVDERLEGSLAAAVYAVFKGASIIRVHDVLQTVRAMTIIRKITEAE